MIWLYVLTLLSVVYSAWAAWQLATSLRHYAWRPVSGEGLAKPSVSVCIPARNEAHALSFCLERVLASDYEKLEILVLDDNSDDDTSVLIKSFAHAGVRFIPGRTLPKGWLGKNHALDTMAREASGDVLLFLDVDTQIEPNTISQILRSLEASGVDMLSVIPQRRDIGRTSVLFGHLRYFWEVVLANSQMPASSSALWLMRKKALLQDLNGLAAIQDHVQPERTLAAWAAARQSYQVVISRPGLGVYYEKRWSSQRETSERLLFPLFTSLLRAAIAAVSLAIWTGGVISTALVVAYPELWPYSAAVLLSGMVAYYTYLRLAWTGRYFLGAIFWPYIVLQEAWFAVSSTLKYATGKVTWKGRSVTAPGLNRHYLTLDE